MSQPSTRSSATRSGDKAKRSTEDASRRRPPRTLTIGFRRVVRGWDEFWFTPEPVARIAAVRSLLAVITAGYLISWWPDLATWYGEDGIQSSARIHSFLIASGLESAAEWYISPLFLTESLLVIRVYLIIGVALAGLVAAGRGGRPAAWALWLVMVGWANRAMFLSGLEETLLSLSLFAAAIAAPGSGWHRGELAKETDWSNGFARQLLSVQTTLFAVATTAAMLAGTVWWNGLGAYALAAPVQDRLMDWTNSPLAIPLTHDVLTHALVFALPIGIVLSWRRGCSLAGHLLIGFWCLAVALLGSHWLYAATLFAASQSIVSKRDR